MLKEQKKNIYIYIYMFIYIDICIYVCMIYSEKMYDVCIFNPSTTGIVGGWFFWGFFLQDGCAEWKMMKEAMAECGW